MFTLDTPSYAHICSRSFHLLSISSFVAILFPLLTRCSHSCKFSPTRAVLSCYNSSEPEPSEKGGSPTQCFHRLQHLDLQTSLQQCPVWGQGHTGGSKKSGHISLVKIIYTLQEGSEQVIKCCAECSVRHHVEITASLLPEFLLVFAITLKQSLADNSQKKRNIYRMHCFLDKYLSLAFSFYFCTISSPFFISAFHSLFHLSPTWIIAILTCLVQSTQTYFL